MAVEVQQIIELILAIFLPPLAIFIHGSDCNIHVAVNIVLCFFFYLPAIIHALCFFSSPFSTLWPHYFNTSSPGRKASRNLAVFEGLKVNNILPASSKTPSWRKKRNYESGTEVRLYLIWWYSLRLPTSLFEALKDSTTPTTARINMIANPGSLLKKQF